MSQNKLSLPLLSWKRVPIYFLLLVVLGRAAFCADDIQLPKDVSARRLAAELQWKGFVQIPLESRPKLILVLGGGGARGLAHLGVLRVFKEERIPIDAVVGVSVGALIGALVADGMDPGEVEKMAAEIGWNELTDFSKVSMIKLILSEELMSTTRMETYLQSHIGQKTFSELKLPFACVATDIQTGERIVFKEGPVAIAARASATFPAVFKPVLYRQRSLVDGGLVDNLPLDIMEGRPGYDLVVAVLPKADSLAADGATVFKALVRSIEIQRTMILKSAKKSADVLLEPDVRDVGIADLNRSKDCIEAGVFAARPIAMEIKEMMLKRFSQAAP